METQKTPNSKKKNKNKNKKTNKQTNKKKNLRNKTEREESGSLTSDYTPKLQ